MSVKALELIANNYRRLMELAEANAAKEAERAQRIGASTWKRLSANSPKRGKGKPRELV